MDLQTACANHPERVGSGICPSCARTVCNECITKIEGINVCTKCLARKMAEEKARRTSDVGIVARVGLPLLAAAGLTAVFACFGLLISMIG